VSTRSGPENSSALAISWETQQYLEILIKLRNKKMTLNSENGPAQSYSVPQALAKVWAAYRSKSMPVIHRRSTAARVLRPNKIASPPRLKP
jgi:hypothetical protein